MNYGLDPYISCFSLRRKGSERLSHHYNETMYRFDTGFKITILNRYRQKGNES